MKISTLKAKVGLLEKEIDQLTIEHPTYLSFSAGICRDEHSESN